MTDANQPEVHRGLKDLCFDRSPTTLIDGRAGELRYRGYSIHDLAAHSSFEETAYLLLHGELPRRSELETFDGALKEARALPGALYDVIRAVKDAHPMDVLRTAVSALAAYDPETGNNALDATRRKGIRLTSQVPMIVTAHHHIRQGRDPVPASAALGHAANFLYMLKGEAPSEDACALMDTDMVLHAEHGSNASSFTAGPGGGADGAVHHGVAEGLGLGRLLGAVAGLHDLVLAEVRRPGFFLRGLRPVRVLDPHPVDVDCHARGACSKPIQLQIDAPQSPPWAR